MKKIFSVAVFCFLLFGCGQDTGIDVITSAFGSTRTSTSTQSTSGYPVMTYTSDVSSVESDTLAVTAGDTFMACSSSDVVWVNGFPDFINGQLGRKDENSVPLDSTGLMYAITPVWPYESAGSSCMVFTVLQSGNLKMLAGYTTYGNVPGITSSTEYLKIVFLRRQ